MPKEKSSGAEIKRLNAAITKLKEERDRLKARNETHQVTYQQISDSLRRAAPFPSQDPSRYSGLSLIIAYYDIPQQIERTLQSCAPAYQGVPEQELEVILVDNGSPTPMPADLQDRFPFVSQILRVEGHPSPVVGLNQGIAAARHEMIGLMIDGAHMLSPGVARSAREIWERFPNPVINVPQYILGEVSQNLVDHSEAFARETEALAALGWPENGYGLFDYAVYPGENFSRSFLQAIESNCLITTRHVLETKGGFDLRYDEPGAGFANLEIFGRLTHDLEHSYLCMPGEGTFHQDHSGTTTKSSPDQRQALVARYRDTHQRITGQTLLPDLRRPFLYGQSRRAVDKVPTISRAYGRTGNAMLKQLANIYVGRLQAGLSEDFRPSLTVGETPDERLARAPLEPAGLIGEAAARNGVEERDLNYLKSLRKMHELVAPKRYFEIGVDTGASLSLARCPAVGVDPSYVIAHPIHAPAQLFRETSDGFFDQEARCAELFKTPIDLAFIDGMHLAEFVLRDFMKTERWMSRDGVILMDDVLPDRMEMLERERRFAAWCGDVYKIVPILRRYRPDLEVSVFETFIGPYRKGLAVITGLDPKNRVLQRNYDQILDEIMGDTYDFADIAALDAGMKPELLGQLAQRARGGQRRGRKSRPSRTQAPSPDPEPAQSGAALPKAPDLSVVLVSHEMGREMPRTLKTLSPDFQAGIASGAYELIVVDNGSAEQPDFAAWAEIAPNGRFYYLPPGNPSPVAAINMGLRQARGAVCGVMIDGARMASPGLLAAAHKAVRRHKKAVVGVHGLHLGEEFQQDAVLKGYGPEAEDQLLAAAGWEADGYRLFDCSVLSKSSAKGWRVLPSESTAIFMHRDRWARLGGYDEGFATAGGGLTNLDLWKRACEAPGARVTLLLGEATFHQIHGGASTGAVSRRALFDAEYEALRGTPYRHPEIRPHFVGRAPHE